MIQTMKKLKSGYINGTRVMLGNLGDFLNTSAITDLSFLGSQEDGCPDSNLKKFLFQSGACHYRLIYRIKSSRSILLGRTSVKIIQPKNRQC